MTTAESTYVHVRRCACGASVEYTAATSGLSREFGAAHLDCDGEAILTSQEFRRTEVTAYRGSYVVASAYHWVGRDDWHVVTSDGTGTIETDTDDPESMLRMLLAAHAKGIRHGRAR